MTLPPDGGPGPESQLREGKTPDFGKVQAERRAAGLFPRPLHAVPESLPGTLFRAPFAEQLVALHRSPAGRCSVRFSLEERAHQEVYFICC